MSILPIEYEPTVRKRTAPEPVYSGHRRSRERSREKSRESSTKKRMTHEYVDRDKERRDRDSLRKRIDRAYETSKRTLNFDHITEEAVRKGVMEKIFCKKF